MSNDREAFEKWLRDRENDGYIQNGVWIIPTLELYEIWQAARAESEKELVASQLREKQMLEVVRDAELWYSSETLIGKALKLKASEALALPSDTKALEIYALEQRIAGLESVRGFCSHAELPEMVEELRTKLTELKGGE